MVYEPLFPPHQWITSERGLRVHYNDVIMGTVASQITSLTIVYSTVNSDADQRKHQSSASLAFVRGIHLGLVNSPHKWPVTQKMFPFDNVIKTRTSSMGNELHQKDGTFFQLDHFGKLMKSLFNNLTGGEKLRSIWSVKRNENTKNNISVAR